MPIEPVKIPQNVQVEDRLIGPITLRQVMICMVGGGISFVLWNAFKKVGSIDPFSLIIAWTPLAISAAFAFIRIQNLSFLRLLLLFTERSTKPSIRRFEPRTGISINIRTYFHTQKQEKHHKEYEVGFDKFKKLSSVLDKESDSTKTNMKTRSHSKTKNVEKEENIEIKNTKKTEQQKPVDQNRISVSPSSSSNIQQASIDGMQSTENIKNTNNKIIRDISHPQT